MNFDELFVTIDTLKMNKNYQPVFIKTLLESTDYQITREKIISKLVEFTHDKEKDWGQIFWDVINEVLAKKKNLIEYTKETKTLRLLVDEELSNEQKLTLIELCDKKILEINSKNQSGIDPVRFQKLHQKFLEHMKIKAQKMSIEPPNDEFTNFQHPYIENEEINYKKEVIEKARKVLSLEKWDEWKSEPSKIFAAVKNACDPKVAGNLLTNPAQYGPDREHKIFEQTDDKRINDLGNEFFKFFNGGSNREEFSIRYDNFIKFHDDNKIGFSSQIFAYLSFLLDPEQYIPIRISKFAALANYYKCSLSKKPSSWADYSALLDMLEEVKSLLENYGKPNTIEAHSYLWIVSGLIPKTNDTKHWLVMPGEDGFDWENQKENSLVGVGFIGVDLSRFFKQDGTYINDNSQRELGDALRARENAPEKKAQNHMVQIQWFMRIKKGEKVVAYFNKTIRGIGEIIGDYEYHETEANSHTKKVRWYDLTEREVPASVLALQPAAMTVQKFPIHWKKWFFNEEDSNISTIMDNEDKELRDITELLKSKKQIVLYGPPGTGKTYNAKRIALQILGKNPDDNPKTQFQSLKVEGKVNLIQFHPSYSYEDFVQGIKPKNVKGQITYEVRDGIFKDMCESLEETDEAGYEEHYFATVEEYVEIDSPFLDKEIGIEVGQPGINKIDNKKFQKIFYKIESQGQEINLKHIETEFTKEDSYFILRERLAKEGETSEYGDKTGIEYHFRPGIPGSTQLPDALDGEKRVPFVYYDKKREGFFGIGILKGMRVQKIPLGEPPKKVLIIDEINRGNLSKIFGELIYALEYRDESIDLQYQNFDKNAKGTLKIPNNLFIIGTMNTADRSIVLFDTAMRRRFAFVPMMPKFKYVLEQLDISEENMEDEIKKKLEDTTIEQKTRDSLLSTFAVIKINNKLTTDENLRLGRERQIGQSYLIGLIEGKISFINLWKFEIIPLLEEYYSSKYERLVELVGDIVDVTNGISDFDEEQLRGVLKDLVGQ